MTRRIILESLLLPLLLIAGAAGVRAQNRWNGILDRYETICERCIELRQRIAAGEAVPDKSVTSLLQELGSLRNTLQEASGAMTPDQKARFRAIQQRYIDATGTAGTITNGAQQRTSASRPVPAAKTKAPGSIASEPVEEPVPVVRTSLGLPGIPSQISGRAYSLSQDQHSPIVSKPAPAEIGTSGSIPASHSLSFDVLALYGYGKAPSFGLMTALGINPLWGVWLAGRSNFAVTGNSYDCTSDGRTDSGVFWGNGNSRYGILALSGGPLWRPLPWLGFYAGAGCAREELDWQDAQGQWARVQDYSYSGICGDAGLLLNWKHLAFSAGCAWSLSATVTLGLGVHF